MSDSKTDLKSMNKQAALAYAQMKLTSALTWEQNKRPQKYVDRLLEQACEAELAALDGRE